MFINCDKYKSLALLNNDPMKLYDLLHIAGDLEIGTVMRTTIADGEYCIKFQIGRVWIWVNILRSYLDTTSISRQVDVMINIDLSETDIPNWFLVFRNGWLFPESVYIDSIEFAIDGIFNSCRDTLNGMWMCNGTEEDKTL